MNNSDAIDAKGSIFDSPDARRDALLRAKFTPLPSTVLNLQESGIEVNKIHVLPAGRFLQLLMVAQGVEAHKFEGGMRAMITGTLRNVFQSLLPVEDDRYSSYVLMRINSLYFSGHSAQWLTETGVIVNDGRQRVLVGVQVPDAASFDLLRTEFFINTQSALNLKMEFTSQLPELGSAEWSHGATLGVSRTRASFGELIQQDIVGMTDFPLTQGKTYTFYSVFGDGSSDTRSISYPHT